MVIEKTTPATVIIELAIVASICRPPSALPAQSQPTVRMNSLSNFRSKSTTPNAAPIANKHISAGMNQ